MAGVRTVQLDAQGIPHNCTSRFSVLVLRGIVCAGGFGFIYGTKTKPTGPERFVMRRLTQAGTKVSHRQMRRLRLPLLLANERDTIMRLTLTLFLITAADMAAAHPGHLADLAGHDHWVAGAAIGAAVLAGLWGALRPKKEKEPEPELEEEAA